MKTIIYLKLILINCYSFFLDVIFVLTPNKHYTDGQNLFVGRVGCHIAEPDTGEGRTYKVHASYVAGLKNKQKASVAGWTVQIFPPSPLLSPHPEILYIGEYTSGKLREIGVGVTVYRQL